MVRRQTVSTQATVQEQMPMDTMQPRQQMGQALAARRSNGRMTAAPVPRSVIDAALSAALWAPDHRRLQPWRFWVVEGKSREQLGEVLAAAQLQDTPDADAALLDKLRQQPLRAPVVVVAGLRHQVDSKVPLIEQVLSMGAAIENFLLMIEAQGYQAMWRSGLLMGHDHVKQAFGLGVDDRLCGFLYVGQAEHMLPPHDPVPFAGLVQDWDGPVHHQEQR